MREEFNKRPSILVIADFPNWAYFEIQQFIKLQLSDEYDIYSDFLIFHSEKKSLNPFSRLKMLRDKVKYQDIKADKNYHIVVFLGFYFTDQMSINFTADKVVKGIFTDGFPPSNANFDGNLEDFVGKYFSNTDAIVCGSSLIKDFYSSHMDRAYFANASLDDELFRRLEDKQLNNTSKFIVGWTGNPKREFKGYYTHILPAVELAKQKYPSIELKVRFSGPIDMLPSFYNDVDVVLIASEKDAGPSLFGEASLMEVPSISTDIGWPHDVIRSGENGFIVERNVEAISERLIFLYENRQELFLMSKKIRGDYLDVFNSDDMAKRWKSIFSELVNKTNGN